MGYQTLIFDFDSRWADTRESIVHAMRFIADKVDVKNFDGESLKSLIGLPLKASFEKALLLDES